MLPAAVRRPLAEHLRRVKEWRGRDLASGRGRWPGRTRWAASRGRRACGPGRTPSRRRRLRPTREAKRGGAPTPTRGRSSGQSKAVRRAGLAWQATSHSFRHSFATHLIGDGYDIRTVRELLGHADVRTAMISTHVLNQGPCAVRSPLDRPPPGGGARSPSRDRPRPGAHDPGAGSGGGAAVTDCPIRVG
jgi:integrase